MHNYPKQATSAFMEKPVYERKPMPSRKPKWGYCPLDISVIAKRIGRSRFENKLQSWTARKVLQSPTRGIWFCPHQHFNRNLPLLMSILQVRIDALFLSTVHCSFECGKRCENHNSRCDCVQRENKALSLPHLHGPENTKTLSAWGYLVVWLYIQVEVGFKLRLGNPALNLAFICLGLISIERSKASMPFSNWPSSYKAWASNCRQTVSWGSAASRSESGSTRFSYQRTTEYL